MPLSFDATGFQQQEQNAWVHPASGDRVVLSYFDLVPDLPASLDDLPALRHELTVLTGESGCLIEAHVVNFGGVPALLRLQKLPLPGQPHGQAFIASITVPKADCSAVLQILCREQGTTGMREAVLLAQIGMDDWVQEHPYAPGFTGKLPFHAGDDARFDAQFPGHPLTRARAWLHHAIRTARVDPGFAALPPFQPAPHNAGPSVAPGDRLQTVVTGVPMGGLLPIWFDAHSVVHWRMEEPDKVLARLGSGTTGRVELEDGWSRDALLYDPDDKTLWMSERYHKPDGGMVVENVAGRPADAAEVAAATAPQHQMAAYQWIGRALAKAAERGEVVVVGPGGTQMFGTPRVLMATLEDSGRPAVYLEAAPAPANAQVWAGQRTAADWESQSMARPVTGPQDYVICGELAGFATEVWQVGSLHLALSVKQQAAV